MGLWSRGTHRKFRWHEFRIEVVFETPVMLTAAPSNMRGPIKRKPIFSLTGSPQSYRDTLLLSLAEEKAADTQAVERIHTADDERASWHTLLSAIQNKENQSRIWDESKRNESIFGKIMVPPDYPLTVQLQRKTRSWDFISPNITKPYATSAICHLVEMMAMLGLYWKAFDQSMWNLRAEGNGFILTSTHVHGLGVMVVFATTGKSNFQEKRVMPCYEIKELAFGTVPNIFENDEYLGREPDAQSLELVFGNDEDVNNTLESLGCQAETLRRYKKDHKHIFSVSFEIIGMLGQCFRIRRSNFRMLPNPTADSWLKKIGSKASWKITRLMDVFQQKLQELVDNEGFCDDHHICKIVNGWKKIGPRCIDEANLTIDVREDIHDALDSQTKYLLSLKQADVLSVVVAHITKVVEVLDDAVSPLNTIVLANKENALFSHYFYEIRPAVIGNLRADKKPLSKSEKEERNIIWISLIFRMLCWLLLHDFDKADIKIVPSDLKGSRMPIYIG